MADDFFDDGMKCKECQDVTIYTKVIQESVQCRI